MLCFVVVMQSLIMNSYEVFIHIHQGCFAGTGALVRLPQCQWSKPDGYGKISQCITTTKHSKAKTVCIFLGIYCNCFQWRPELASKLHVRSMVSCKCIPRISSWIFSSINRSRFRLRNICSYDLLKSINRLALRRIKMSVLQANIGAIYKFWDLY